MSFGISMCVYCKHYDAGQCRAFPDGRPPLLVAGSYDHRYEYPGDAGIQFEADDEDEWQESVICQDMDGPFKEYYALLAKSVIGEARLAAEAEAAKG